MKEKHEIGCIIDLINRASHRLKFGHEIQTDSWVEVPMCRNFYTSPSNFDLPKFFCSPDKLQN
jgi:hypothetical protein